jgi:putative sigma-54 modulation protein
MDIQFTARHFKAHDTLKGHAMNEVQRLGKYYDGIVNAYIILSFEKSRDSVKIAEISLVVHGAKLIAIEKSEDFTKSINFAIEKLERQLKKYKERMRKKRTVRKQVEV